jgi:hypothetical protein
MGLAGTWGPWWVRALCQRGLAGTWGPWWVRAVCQRGRTGTWEPLLERAVCQGAPIETWELLLEQAVCRGGQAGTREPWFWRPTGPVEIGEPWLVNLDRSLPEPWPVGRLERTVYWARTAQWEILPWAPLVRRPPEPWVRSAQWETHPQAGQRELTEPWVISCTCCSIAVCDDHVRSNEGRASCQKPYYKRVPTTARC